MKNYQRYELTIPDDFKHDGCTLAPDGSWGSCCRIHDHARLNHEVSGKEADAMLFECMVDRSNIVLACVYWLFVRVQGILDISPSMLMILGLFAFFLAIMFYFG